MPRGMGPHGGPRGMGLKDPGPRDPGLKDPGPRGAQGGALWGAQGHIYVYIYIYT